MSYGEQARCRSARCGATITWVQTVAQRWMPVDAVPLGPDARVAPSHVAVHVPSRRGYVLAGSDFDADGNLTPAWADRDDVRYFTAHHATCVAVADFRVAQGQGTLL